MPNGLTSRLLALGIFVYAFHAGAGIDFPYINWVGNFGLGDLALVTIVLGVVGLARIPLRAPWLSLLPLALGALALTSWWVAAWWDPEIFNPDAWGYVARWFTYALLIWLMPAVVISRAGVVGTIDGILLGIVALALVNWGRWLAAPVPSYGALALPYLTGSEFNPNTFGYYLSFGVALALLRMRSVHDFMRKALLGSVTAFLLVSAILTMSKGTWITVSALVLVVVLAVHGLTRRQIAGRILGGGVLVATFYLSGLAATVQHAVDLRWGASTSTNQQRIEMIQTGFQIASDYPLLGAGPKSYETLRDRYDGKARDPHNVYAWLAAELGYGGLCLYLAYAGIAYPALLVKLHRTESALARSKPAGVGFRWFPAFAVLWAGNVLQGFVTGLPASEKLFWLSGGALAAALVIRRRELAWPARLA